MSRRRTVTVAGVATAVIVVAILLITLTPEHIDRNLGNLESVIVATVQRAPGFAWFDYNWLERIANIIMFAPLAALVTYLVGIRRWWIVLLGCAALSAAIELAQLLFLPERTASLGDVLSNTIGGAVGIGIIALVTRMRRRG
jgi:glycopeptide antibiotics resistance protein